jgi:hypothetical protein
MDMKKSHDEKSKEEEEEMLALKENNKKIGCASDNSYTPAKTKDVLKAIKKSHKKHSDSLKLLAK